MWEQMFPDVDINTEFVKSDNFLVVLSNLYKNNKLENLERKMVQTHKIESSTVKKVLFLLEFMNFDSDDVFYFYKKKRASGIDNQTISEWIKVNNFKNKWMIKFLDYSPTISATDLMERGIKGVELGQKIKELEAENFKKS
jgi:hypothetical protein